MQNEYDPTEDYYSDDYGWSDDEDPEWENERNRGIPEREPPRAPEGVNRVTPIHAATGPNDPTPKPSRNPRRDAVERHWDFKRDGPFNMYPDDMYEIVTPNDRALYLCLIHHAGQNLICWPSRRKISEDSGLTSSQIITSEQHLIDGRWLAMEEWKSISGDRAPYCYILFPLCRKYTDADLGVRIPYGGWHVPKVENAA